MASEEKRTAEGLLSHRLEIGYRGSEQLHVVRLWPCEESLRSVTLKLECQAVASIQLAWRVRKTSHPPLDLVGVQAKRYGKKNTVKRPEIQAFVGALQGAQTNRGVFVTTGRFSDGARQFLKASACGCA
jgi:Restriction endonuclease